MTETLDHAAAQLADLPAQLASALRPAPPRLGGSRPDLIKACSWSTVFQRFPWLKSAFQEIPGEFWVADVEDDKTSVAVVACPCGEEPRVAENQSHQCPCGRFYLNASGESAYVTNTPKEDRWTPEQWAAAS